MYFFFALFLFFVFLILTVAGETGRGRNHPRRFFFINLALAAGGVLIVGVAFFLANHAVFHSGFDAEFSEWAWDMLTVYYQLSLIPMAVFFGIGTLSFLIAAADPKQCTGFPLKLRLSVMVTFSAVLLMLAPMYSFMTVNEQVALDACILFTGCGEALILRAPLLLEYGRRMKQAPGKSVTGK